MNCGEFLKHTHCNCDGEFLQHTLSNSTEDCSEFNQGLRSDWLIAADFIKSLVPDKLKSLKTVNCDIFHQSLI